MLKLCRIAPLKYRALFLTLLFVGLHSSGQTMAQDSGAEENDLSVIDSAPAADQDASIQQRLENIFGEVDSLSKVTVQVNEGIVRLSGEVANEAAADKAITLAGRVKGIVTVEDELQRTLTIEDNLNPAVQKLYETLRQGVRAIPLLLLAGVVLILIAGLGRLLASWQSLWQWALPNSFLAELAGQIIFALALFGGLIAALNIIGATGLISTILGGLGLVGLAIGFAVRDTIENFVASIMLSLRQPFRSQDHVVIGDCEGIVSRLTSRATILMTLNGNHLRIPNSTVFKAVILNYTRNPERRFEFSLGVDADDDPAAAMSTGISAIKALDWVLEDPPPLAIIETVGDSSIIVKFMGWLDQRNTDFGKGRSMAIREVKTALEQNGFTLPEPIYRLRFDNAHLAHLVPSTNDGKAPDRFSKPESRRRQHDASLVDLEPETHVKEEAGRERSQQHERDLLDSSRPIE